MPVLVPKPRPEEKVARPRSATSVESYCELSSVQGVIRVRVGTLCGFGTGVAEIFNVHFVSVKKARVDDLGEVV